MHTDIRLFFPFLDQKPAIRFARLLVQVDVSFVPHIAEKRSASGKKDGKIVGCNFNFYQVPIEQFEALLGKVLATHNLNLN